ncbi:hypothetical protein [Methanobacterium aggregans]|uniref:hypothetical protein n=1 Tax=Methanobacterium aggregans TaxID=1615586 RepID=UPI001AE7DD0A|nr:hypothetical protein [Methanobacterium aggregans]MBP2046796.1 hypothetical protein [Methanobacterium aggregans]
MISLVDIEGTVLVLLLVLIVGFSTFFGFVGTSSSANDTNVTNTTNDTNFTSDSFAVTDLDDPEPSATDPDADVSLEVTPSANLSNRIADGSELPYPSVTQVNVTADETTWRWEQLNDKLNLYVKVTGDLISPSDSIPLDNFKYDGFSNSSLSKTSFKTDYNKVKSWNFQYTNVLLWRTWSVSDSVNGNYYLTVPMGSAGETYTTTVYYLVIIQ